jgi:hypothetical protein
MRIFKGFIRDCNPIRIRGKYGHRKRSSDTWLIKAGEPPVAIKRLKMSINIDFSIDRVYITMEP